MESKFFSNNLELYSGAGAVRAHGARFPRGWERGVHRNGHGRTGAALHAGKPLTALKAIERQINTF